MQTAANELGIVVEGSSVEMTTDSSSEESFASRRSSSRIRHIEVKWPWLQQAVADGRFRMSKEEGALNPEVNMAKYKGLRAYEEQLTRIDVEMVSRDPGKKVWESPSRSRDMITVKSVQYLGRVSRTAHRPVNARR